MIFDLSAACSAPMPRMLKASPKIRSLPTAVTPVGVEHVADRRRLFLVDIFLIENRHRLRRVDRDLLRARADDETLKQRRVARRDGRRVFFLRPCGTRRDHHRRAAHKDDPVP